MKRIGILFILLSVLVMSSCAPSVKQEEYDQVTAELSDQKKEYDELKTQCENLQNENSNLKGQVKAQEKENSGLNSELSSVKKQLKSVTDEYANYQNSMKEYEGLAKAEAEARRIEAEQAAKEESDRKAQEEADKKAQEEAEKKAGYETGITFEQLARTPDEYKGKKVKFYGKVVQTIEGSTINAIRFAVDGEYDWILYGTYLNNLSYRILEDDYITIYGVANGLKSYTATSGAQITIPEVIIDKIDLD